MARTETALAWLAASVGLEPVKAQILIALGVAVLVVVVCIAAVS